MKTVAYLRVSSAQQDAGSQRLALLEYAGMEGAGLVVALLIAFPNARFGLGLQGGTAPLDQATITAHLERHPLTSARLAETGLSSLNCSTTY